MRNTAGIYKILIVDDSPELLVFMQLALKKNDYQVLSAHDGKEALELIEKLGVPDLIFLDMRMPVMDGREFSKVFNDLYGRSAPIVIMTASEDSRTRAIEIGADSYLGKPFEVDLLLDTVENMLPREEDSYE